MGDLNVTLHHDGVFVPNPLKLVLNNVKHIYYCLPDNTLTRGIRKLKKDIDMVEFMRIGYENDKQMDLFIEHDVYDVLEYTANDNLVAKNFSNDNFIGARSDPIPFLIGNYNAKEDGSEVDIIDPIYKKKLRKTKKRIRKRVKVCSSGYQVLEVRRRDESYKVNQIERGCFCKLWDLSGILCMHVVAAYMHLYMDLELGHNKQTCTIEKQPKPQKSGKPPSYKQYSKHGTGSNIGRGGGIVGRIGRSNSKIGGGSVGRGGGSSSKIGSRSVCRGGGSNMGKGGGSTTSRGIGSSGKRGGRSVGRGGGSNMGRGYGSNSKRGSGSTTSRGSGSSSKRGGGSNSKRGGMKRGW
ncbi:splicing factor [Tanacetum coccineum]